MIHDSQAPALFLCSFRHAIRSIVTIPRLTALYLFPCLSSNTTLIHEVKNFQEEVHVQHRSRAFYFSAYTLFD